MSTDPARKRLLLVSLLVCTAALSMACQASDSASTAPPDVATTNADRCAALSAGRLSATPSRALETARDRVLMVVSKEPTPTGYAGLEMCGSANTVLIYWKGVQPNDLRRAVSAEGGRVQVLEANYSAYELSQLVARIRADETYWSGRSIQINSLGARQDGSAVDAGLSGRSDVRDLAKMFKSRYGAEPVVVKRNDGGGNL